MVDKVSKQGQQSLRVSPDVWRRARVKALGAGESMTAVVQRLLVGWLGEVEAPTPKVPARTTERKSAPAPVAETWAGVKEPEKPKAEKLADVRAAVAAVTGKPADDAKCVCGEKWSLHQSGGGELALRTNCRKFREA